KPRNIRLLAIHTRIDRVFRRNLLVEEGLLGIRDIGQKREPKKDLSCIILHNLECYQLWYVDQIIQCTQKFLDSWRYRTTYLEDTLALFLPVLSLGQWKVFFLLF